MSPANYNMNKNRKTDKTSILKTQQNNYLCCKAL